VGYDKFNIVNLRVNTLSLQKSLQLPSELLELPNMHTFRYLRNFSQLLTLSFIHYRLPLEAYKYLSVLIRGLSYSGRSVVSKKKIFTTTTNLLKLL
jgi:hypothetical protein